MTDPLSLAIITFAFLAGGFVKGIAGLGLPIVTVAILTFAFGLQNAMALMVAPGLLSNAWQAVSGSQTVPALKRISPFMLPSLLTIWLGTGLLVTLDSSYAVVMLGIILLIYSITGISGFSVDIPPRHERWVGPGFGMVCGVTTGMTGVTSTPSVIYLNGLGMAREMFIQAMGLHFCISYIVLTIALWMRGLLNLEIGILTLLAVIPTIGGQWIGRKLRLKTSETGFKWIFYRVLFAMAIYLIFRAVF